jgi:hypothetical protein
MPRIALLTSAIALVTAAPALAGPSATTTNFVNITQVSGSNDTVKVTQIGGLTAAQTGEANGSPNTATITQTNSNNTITLVQDSTTTIGNIGSVGGGSVAQIQQTNTGQSTGENATVTQKPGEGYNNIDNASVTQIGSFDTATLIQGATSISDWATINQGGGLDGDSMGNTATIRQGTASNPAGGGFNTATINQGNNGPALSDSATIVQDGNYDKGTINQEGGTQDSFATITQGQGSYSETATITQLDTQGGVVSISQYGNTDTASATQVGTGDNISIQQTAASMNSSAQISQFGNNDIASVSQQRPGESMALSQYGNNQSVSVVQK